MLHLVGAATPENLADADAICTASQLISFWQDVAADWKKDRVYLPLADLRRFNVTEAHIANGVADDAWRALMALRSVVRARDAGARRAARAADSGAAGHRVVRRRARRPALSSSASRRRGYDVFRERPVLNTFDWCVVAARTVVMWLSRRVGVEARSIEGNA